MKINKTHSPNVKSRHCESVARSNPDDRQDDTTIWIASPFGFAMTMRQFADRHCEGAARSNPDRQITDWIASPSARNDNKPVLSPRLKAHSKKINFNPKIIKR
jgi:hypothetical protein